MSSSKENNFTTLADSAAGHPLPSPLADRCHAVYQLQSTTELPFLPGFLQSLAVVSPLLSTIHSIPPGCRSCVWGVIVEHSSQRAAAVFYLVISTVLQFMLGCECSFSVSTYFTPSPFSTKTEEPCHCMRCISERAEHWGRSEG